MTMTLAEVLTWASDALPPLTEADDTPADDITDAEREIIMRLRTLREMERQRDEAVRVRDDAERVVIAARDAVWRARHVLTSALDAESGTELDGCEE